MKQFENTGIYLRNIREGLDKTQHQLSKILKCNPQFVSNWERGLCLPPEKELRTLNLVSKEFSPDLFIRFVCIDTAKQAKMRFRKIFDKKPRRSIRLGAE